MTTISTAILLLSGTWASGFARDCVQSPESIAGTMLRIGVGVIAEKTGDGLADVASRVSWAANERVSGSPSLSIDGQSAAGIRGTIRAFGRILAYIADFRHDGSVGLSGQRTIRGLSVRWRSEVCDGRLTFTADVSGQMGEYLKHVNLRLWAVEDVRGGTVVTGTATGYAYYDRCLGKRIFAREARRQIPIGLQRELLGRIHTVGAGLFRGGDAELKALIEGLRNGIRSNR